MKNKVLKHLEDGSTHCIAVRSAEIALLPEGAIPNDAPGNPVQPGVVLHLDMPKGLHDAALRQRGLVVKVGHARRGDQVILALLIRAGAHVAACLADLGDPEVQELAMRVVSEGELQIAMTTRKPAFVSLTRIPEESLNIFRAAPLCRPVKLVELVSAAWEQGLLLSDDGFLAAEGIDTRGLRSRTLFLVEPPLARSSLDGGGNVHLSTTVH